MSQNIAYFKQVGRLDFFSYYPIFRTFAPIKMVTYKHDCIKLFSMTPLSPSCPEELPFLHNL